MDFIRYEKEMFYDNVSFSKDSGSYIKLDTLLTYLKETYTCFNPNLKNEIYTKKILKKPQFIQLNKDIHSSKKHLISFLNKLTSSNYATIYNKIMLSVRVHDATEFIEIILTTCMNAKSYHELYVGLIFHIFDYGSDEIKGIITIKMNEYFMLLFDKSFYVSIDDKDESYDKFCDRMTTKSKTIFTVKSYMIYNLHHELYSYLDKDPQCLIEFLYDQLNSHPVDDAKTIELILLCVIECYQIKEGLIIPSVNDKILWKHLIDIDYNLINLLNKISSDCKSSKIRFLILDLLDILSKYFQVKK